MKKKHRKKMYKLFSYFIVLASTALMAQQSQITGIIPTIQTDDGLHKIELPSLVRSYAAATIHDFRIFDASGVQVPYFVHRDANETQVSGFTEFEILSQNKLPDSSTTYIFKNPNRELKSVVLSIANYEGSKRVSVEGSEDQKQWFGLVNSKHLYHLKSTTKTSVYSVLDFPLTSYRYIRIVFDDRYTFPVNVLKIGTATTTKQRATLTPIAVQELRTKEVAKEKKTKLHVRFEHPQILHQLDFDISAPKFYNRNARVYTIEKKKVKNKEETYKKYRANFVLRSDGAKRFSIPIQFERELFIEIDNQDNPKLQIDKVTFFQEPLYVIADLKKGEEYTISAGDQTLKAPKYDLSYFKNRISDALPTVAISNVQLKMPPATSNTEKVSFWQQPWFMWCCIGLAGVLIAYFASSLIKDLKKEA